MRVKESSGVDLGAAEAVVAVGRGLKAREDLALITDLAAAMGAELACSRPLAEGVDWVAKERYVGISGQHITPRLYLAIGISGQLQHMVGVRGAGVVVAVNKDKDAPVFRQCDYGIVGDLYQVVPALDRGGAGGVVTSAEPDFDVIVVGAGPAGSVAAYRLAAAGLSVVLIERGEAPGAKNLSGGVLYGRVLDEVFPGFADTAPVERRITRHVTTFLTADSHVSIDYAGAGLASPVNAVTVLRAKLDAWLAERAEEAGVFVMSGVRVDGLLREAGPDGTQRVVGVRAGDDELRARVVVAADGVNSFLARGIGLSAEGSRATTWPSGSRPS